MSKFHTLYVPCDSEDNCVVEREFLDRTIASSLGSVSFTFQALNRVLEDTFNLVFGNTRKPGQEIIY